MKNLNEVQIAGLLHDFGKFIRKYNNGNGTHAVLSGEFIANNKELCLGCDSDTIIGLAAAHHSDKSQSYTNTVGTSIEPSKKVTATTANEVYNLAEKADRDLLRILTLADSLSASSDRRSETGDGTKGHCEYAPLWSPISQVFGDRLAIKSGYEYKVYDYTGTDDLKATVLSPSNDNEFESNILSTYIEIKNGLSKLTDIESLLALLEKCWSTVNANTWRPADSTLGNTTTSLFDHSKTTSAIAGCLFINKQNGKKVNDEISNIDIWHLTSVGKHLVVRDVVKTELSRIGLSSACIIGNTDNEIYFMYPSSEADGITENIKQLNKDIFKKYGETINFEVAKNWQFKNCDKSLSERFSTKFIGVLDVINTVDSIKKAESNKENESQTLAGFKLNHYNYMIEQIVKNNDSISKLATTLRVFEMFSKDVEAYLRKHECRVVEQSFDKCIYVADKEDVHQLEIGISNLYKKYVLNCTGLTFSSVTTDRYSDGVSLLNSELESFSEKRKLEDRGSYIKIRNKLFKIEALDSYRRVVAQADKVSKSTLFKILKLYDEILRYESDSNAEHLVSLSKFQYLISNEGDENNKAFETKCSQAIWDSEQSKIKSLATVYYEAILEASRRKRWTQDI